MAEILGITVKKDGRTRYIFFVNKTKRVANFLGVYEIWGIKDNAPIGEFSDLEGIAVTTPIPLDGRTPLKATLEFTPGRHLVMLELPGIFDPTILNTGLYRGRISCVQLAGQQYAKLKGDLMPREVPNNKTHLYLGVEEIVDDSKPV